LTEARQQGTAAAAAARKEGSAAAHAADLEKLKDFATKVLAGQAKAADYSGPENKPLANILGKLDAMGSASSNDICALVYFVSYFLNTMIKPKLSDLKLATGLIENIKQAITLTAPESKDLFHLIMAIQPSLLLANKIMPQGADSSGDTMNYFITQRPSIDILKKLFNFKASLSSHTAWRVVRGEKGTDKNMRFYLNKDANNITLLYRTKPTDTKKEVKTYGIDGILEFKSRATTQEEYDDISNLERLNESYYITYDLLFLIFLYASRQYIVNNRASIACTVPMEIINNINVLKNPLKELKGQAATLSIRIPAAAAPATPSPGPPESPPALAAQPPPPASVARPPLTAEQRAALVAANVAAQMAAAEALRPAKAPPPSGPPSPAPLPSEAAALAKANEGVRLAITKKAAEEAAAVARARSGQWVAKSAAQNGARRPATPLSVGSFSPPSPPVASAPPQIYLEAADKVPVINSDKKTEFIKNYVAHLASSSSGVRRFTIMMNSHPGNPLLNLKNKIRLRLAFRMGDLKYSSDATIRTRSFNEIIQIFINLSEDKRNILLNNDIGISGVTYNYSLKPYLEKIMEGYHIIVNMIIEDLNKLSTPDVKGTFIKRTTAIDGDIIKLADEVITTVGPNIPLRKVIKDYKPDDPMLDLLLILNIGGALKPTDIMAKLTAIRQSKGGRRTQKKRRQNSKKFTQRKR
jgi:hypothetical protein